MKRVFVCYLSLLLSFFFHSCKQSQVNKSTNQDEYPIYTGPLEEAIPYLDAARFRLWSPAAEAARVHVYWSATPNPGIDSLPKRHQVFDMKPASNGCWEVLVEAQFLEGKAYTFQTKFKGKWSLESPGPWAKAVGVNGQRGVLVDLETLYRPRHTLANERINDIPLLKDFSEVILYEVHIRDFSIQADKTVQHKGKFKGMEQSWMDSDHQHWKGLYHLKDLGVTHVHLLPAFDFRSIDESRPDDPQYNWGYDPENYNVPEGSYSTKPEDGITRIKEFKSLIKSIHDAGLLVVMDVVYNHTGKTETSKFHQLVPGYYYRHREDGSFSNASACGNEIASERPMVRRMIVESVAYWAEQYQVDGFRFDLMGIHDLETMRAVRERLNEINPAAFIYGEGWAAGDSPLPDSLRATKNNTSQIPGIAVFSDEFRDGVKGHFAEKKSPGWVGGKAPRLKESVKFGMVGAIAHPDVDLSKVNKGDIAWAAEPLQCINYVSCHDDLSLWDKLELAHPEASEADRISMHKLCLGLVLTSQGVPFLHAGSEFLRTKHGDHNSFESPDSINAIDWSRKDKYLGVSNYVKQLIKVRKAFKGLHLGKAEHVRQYVSFPEPVLESSRVLNTLSRSQEEARRAGAGSDSSSNSALRNVRPLINNSRAAGNVMIMVVDPKGEQDFQKLYLIVNADNKAVTLDVFPQNEKQLILANEHEASAKGLKTIPGGKVSVPPYSLLLTTPAK